jgi:hypothetical protein
MLTMQYSHRLPADYDLQLIRRRAAERGPLWDDRQGLACKAFVATEKDRHGANGNLYASVYLWRDLSAATAFLTGESFQGVIDSFGRPQVHTWLTLDAQLGPAREALALYEEVVPLTASADRQQVLNLEIERNRLLADSSDTVVAWTALDPDAWQLLRFRLSAAAAQTLEGQSVYEVLYLAQPELEQLR